MRGDVGDDDGDADDDDDDDEDDNDDPALRQSGPVGPPLIHLVRGRGAFTVIVDGGIGRRGDHDEGRKGSVGNANELLYLIIMMWGGLLIPS